MLGEQALALGALGAGARADARGVSGTVATIRPHWPTTRPAPCHDTTGDTATIRQPCARLGLLGACACAFGRACWACWVLVHLAWLFGLFFDSMIFLSHCLDSVHEHCSS